MQSELRKKSEDQKELVPDQVPSRFKLRSHVRILQQISPRELKARAFRSGPTSFLATQMAQIYGLIRPRISRSVTLAVISLGGSVRETDCKTYWQECGLLTIPSIVIVPIQGARYVYGRDPGSDIENALDVQISGAMAAMQATSVTVRFYSAPNSLGGFLAAIKQANTDNVNTISISWGANEIAFGRFWLSAYDTAFQTSRLKGINVFAAAGDNGSTDGGRGLNVDFPSSSPNVVSCGGTTLICPTLNYSDSSTVETAWSYNPSEDWGGGGGVSAYFTRPSFQNGIAPYGLGAVQTYRTVPDISGPADPVTGNWRIFYNGNWYLVGGTSCDSPFFAGFVAGLNIRRSILPQLYSSGNRSSGFHDVRSGSNNNSNFSNRYTAGTGYDCCTGLGSLNGSSISL